jgi:hypothetical protein
MLLSSNNLLKRVFSILRFTPMPRSAHEGRKYYLTAFFVFRRRHLLRAALRASLLDVLSPLPALPPFLPIFFRYSLIWDGRRGMMSRHLL